VIVSATSTKQDYRELMLPNASVCGLYMFPDELVLLPREVVDSLIPFRVDSLVSLVLFIFDIMLPKKPDDLSLLRSSF